MTDPIAEMQKAVNCLALEVVADIHDDVRARWQAVVDEVRELREVVNSCVYDGWFPSYTGGAGWEWYAAVSSLPTDIALTSETIAVVERAGPT